MRLMLAHSWLPRSRKKFSGYLILYARSRQMVSNDCLPTRNITPVMRYETSRIAARPTAVDVVAQKEVVALGREATVFEQPQQVVVLAVHITCHTRQHKLHMSHGQVTQRLLPQIFNGASNSSRMGCERNISRDFMHRPLISFSVSCTFLPGFEPRTANAQIVARMHNKNEETRNMTRIAVYNDA